MNMSYVIFGQSFRGLSYPHEDFAERVKLTTVRLLLMHRGFPSELGPLNDFVRSIMCGDHEILKNVIRDDPDTTDKQLYTIYQVAEIMGDEIALSLVRDYIMSKY